MTFDLKLINMMFAAGLTLDRFTYNALIHGFCKVNDIDQAKEARFRMLNAGLDTSLTFK